MELLSAIASGFALGCIHAFDVDHLAAVTAFASKHPGVRKASMFGVVWGLGHTVTLLLFGTLSLALKLVIPPAVVTAAEFLVGGLLVVIGIWVLRDVLRRKKIHIHRHTHDGYEHVHFHSHEEIAGHRHKHSMFFVGAAHGFAGTAAVLVLVPIAVTQSLIFAVVYLLLFGVGTIVAMALIATLLGGVTHHAGSRQILPIMQGTAGAVSLVIGLVWIGQRLM